MSGVWIWVCVGEVYVAVSVQVYGGLAKRDLYGGLGEMCVCRSW